MEGLSHITSAEAVENVLPLARPRPRKTSYTKAGIASAASLAALAMFAPKAADASTSSTYSLTSLGGISQSGTSSGTASLGTLQTGASASTSYGSNSSSASVTSGNVPNSGDYGGQAGGSSNWTDTLTVSGGTSGNFVVKAQFNGVVSGDPGSTSVESSFVLTVTNVTSGGTSTASAVLQPCVPGSCTGGTLSQTLSVNISASNGDTLSLSGSLGTLADAEISGGVRYHSNMVSGSAVTTSFQIPAGFSLASTNGTLVTVGGVTNYQGLQPAVASLETLGGCNLPNTNKDTCLVGDPIDVATGNVYERVVDYQGAASGGVAQNSLTFERHFNSLSAASNLGNCAGKLGSNWQHNYESCLNITSSGGSVTSVAVQRADGQVLTFTPSGGSYVTNSDVDVTLSNSGSTWTVKDHGDNVDTYTAISSSLALLTSTSARNGYAKSFTYNGSNQLTTVTDSYSRSLSLTYTGGGLVDTVTTPGGLVLTYGYNSVSVGGGTANVLASVAYNTTPATSQTYLYENPAFPLSLTGVTDQNGQRASTWTYDALGRGTSSQGALGAATTIVAFNDATGKPVVSNALGLQETYTLITDHGVKKVSQIDRAALGSVAAASRTFTYDANGFEATETDWNSNSTHRTNNGHGQPTSVTEAFGTALARTTSITYDPTFVRLPATIIEPTQSSTRTTGFTYDASGNTQNRTVTDNGTGHSRAWNYTYNGTGEMLTAQDPRSHTTTMTYSSGNLATVTDALSHVTHFTSYDSDGRLKVFTDPNSLTTTLGYDTRGQLTSRALGSETTTYTRDKTETVTAITNPDSSVLTLGRDIAHRLTSITDSLGEQIVYTVDNLDNRLSTNVYDSSSTANRHHTYTFDALGRLRTDFDTHTHTTTYGYDSNSNLTSVTDPLSNQTQYAYDQLNRVKTVTDPLLHATAIAYSADTFNLASQVVTQRGVTTQYTFDGFGGLTQLSSQDSGLTNYTFDAAGNVATKLDANGVTTTNTWDNLNRLTNAAYSGSGGNDSYTWDTATNGIGRLASATGRMGETTNYSFDLHGRVTQEQIVQGTRTFNTGYSFDAYGRNSGITYPSGLAVTYGFDSAGQINTLSVNGSSFLSSIVYQPFGPVKSWTWGAGSSTSYFRDRDQDGRLVDHAIPGSYRSFGYDNDSRLSSTGDSSNSQTFGYDAASQINAYTATFVSQSYTYDNDGNRATKVTGAGSTSYSITSTSNVIQSRTEPGPTTVTYAANADGTIASEGTSTFTYDKRERMITMAIPSLSQSTSYTVDAFGRRIAKAGTGGTWFNSFDVNGDNIGDYSTASSGASAVPLNETIRLPSNAGELPLPVGIATNGSSATPANMFRIYAGFLSEPREISDASVNLRWQWPMTDAFGNTAANNNPSGLGAFTYNLRWPGQAFDIESGNHYNMNRDYEPTSGRYIQSDPLGLKAGIATYNYVANNPANNIDPRGLQGFVTPLEAGAVALGLAAMAPPVIALTRQVGQAVKNICTPADPGNCTPEQQQRYQENVENQCGAAKQCYGTDPVDILNQKIGQQSACIDARELINNVCYGGGDAGHNQQIRDRVNAIRNCQRFITNSGLQ